MGRTIYCDHNATTPPDPRVVQKTNEIATAAYGNPSSPHRAGQVAKGHLEESRAVAANFLGAKPSEIVFTSSGTEADNLAIFGVAYAHRGKGRHLVTTAIEHHAVLSSIERLSALGWEATILPVDRFGMVDSEEFRRAVRNDTVLASVMLANNEVGTIQPIRELARIARERGVLFHTDAVQAIGKLRVNVEELGADLLSLSAHKFYGPKGVGALYVRAGTIIDAHIYGGGQESKLRSGTENVPAVVGMALALRFLQEHPNSNDRASQIAEDFTKKLFAVVPDITLHGHPEQRIKSTVNVGLHGANGEALVIALDLHGICVSSGAACSTGAIEPSHVLTAMGFDQPETESSIRFSFGRSSEPDDADVMVEALASEVERLRRMSPVYRAGILSSRVVDASS